MQSLPLAAVGSVKRFSMVVHKCQLHQVIMGCSDDAAQSLNPECWMADSNIGDENDAPPEA
eukprot:77982-Chlamydomonas_euryale.AAC.1